MCYLTLQMEEELCEISHANFHVNYIGHFFFYGEDRSLPWRYRGKDVEYMWLQVC